jgi:hypothetical protein
MLYVSQGKNENTFFPTYVLSSYFPCVSSYAPTSCHLVCGFRSMYRNALSLHFQFVSVDRGKISKYE